MDITTVVAFCVLILLVWYHICSFPMFLNFAWSCLVFFFIGCYLIISNIPLPLENVFSFLRNESKLKQKQQPLDNIGQESVPLGDDAYDDEISQVLRKIIGHIVKDFILDWYNNISNDVEFVQEAFELFEYLFSETRKRVADIDKDDLVKRLIRLKDWVRGNI